MRVGSLRRAKLATAAKARASGSSQQKRRIKIIRVRNTTTLVGIQAAVAPTQLGTRRLYRSMTLSDRHDVHLSEADIACGDPAEGFF